MAGKKKGHNASSTPTPPLPRSINASCPQALVLCSSAWSLERLRWEFGLATVLMCGLLFQYAVERMNTIVEASIANGLKDMGWDAETELDEQTMDKDSEHRKPLGGSHGLTKP